MLSQVRSPAQGECPVVGFLEGPGSKPPLPLEGAGSVSNTWQVILGKDGGLLTADRALLPAPPCVLAHELGGLFCREAGGPSRGDNH